MANDYDYDDDGMLDFDDDYQYVEDSFDMADDLVEHAVASPPYIYDEVEMDNMDDYDVYNYWGDVEYGSDSYWDAAIRQMREDKQGKAGDKRKRGSDELDMKVNKRKGGDAQQMPNPDDSKDEKSNVIFRSFQDRCQLVDTRPVVQAGSQSTFALLPDWKERFSKIDGFVFGANEMPDEMKIAMEAQEEHEQGIASGVDQTSAQGEDDWTDDEATGVDADVLKDLDPDTIKAVLQHQMAQAGMQGVETETFMSTITDMLAGGGDVDDLVGKLTQDLLGKRKTSGNSGLSEWLAQQGVDLEQEDDEDTASVATAAPAADSEELEASPPDSAVALLAGQDKKRGGEEGDADASSDPATLQVRENDGRLGRTSTMHKAIEAAAPSSPSVSATKRLAPCDTDEGRRKRKKVAFTEPEELHLVSNLEETTSKEDGAKPSERPTRKLPIHGGQENAAKSKALPSATESGSVKEASTKARKGRVDQVPPSEEAATAAEAQAKNIEGTKATKKARFSPIPEDAPAKQTAKRKASDQGLAAETAEPPKKRQARNFAAPTASTRSKAEPTRRTTRNMKK